MVKRLDDLAKEERGIITVLKTSKGNALDIDEIKRRLDRDGYPLSKEKIRDDIGKLISYGSVRACEQEEDGTTIKKYYLSRILGSGKRNKASLMGYVNPFRDFYRAAARWFGSIFLLFGLAFLVYQRAVTSTGAVISTNQTPDVGLILNFALIIIGLGLLLESNNK